MKNLPGLAPILVISGLTGEQFVEEQGATEIKFTTAPMTVKIKAGCRGPAGHAPSLQSERFLLIIEVFQ
jgi:hypothetical protein